jgi:hypothetical protein
MSPAAAGGVRVQEPGGREGALTSRWPAPFLNTGATWAGEK